MPTCRWLRTAPRRSPTEWSCCWSRARWRTRRWSPDSAHRDGNPHRSDRERGPHFLDEKQREPSALLNGSCRRVRNGRHLTPPFRRRRLHDAAAKASGRTLTVLATTYGATAVGCHRRLARAVRLELDGSRPCGAPGPCEARRARSKHCTTTDTATHGAAINSASTKATATARGQDSCKHAQCTLAVAKDRH